MPPSKSRRMMGPPGGNILQQKLDFKTVKHAPAKKSHGFKSGNFKDLKHNEQLKKLRIPAVICKALPSVRRYANSKGYIDTTDSKANKQEIGHGEDNGEVLGKKRGRGGVNKYKIRQISERKFEGMIWNVEFSPSGEVVVSCGTGTFLCDLNLQVKSTLDHIRTPGGVAFLSDHRIVAICRFFDTINIFTSTGALIRSFSGGTSPTNVAVNSMDEIIVTDIGAKCLRMYHPDGSLIRVIAQEGTNYQMRWPLYLCVTTDDSIILSDCHQQKVMLFDFKGRYVQDLTLTTCAGNEVLRPHGVCTTVENDIFVVDNATDSVEVFSKCGSFIQTVIPPEKGSTLKPKVLRVSEDGHFVVGGMTGIIRLYKCLDHEEVDDDLIMVKEEVTKEDVIILD